VPQAAATTRLLKNRPFVFAILTSAFVVIFGALEFVNFIPFSEAECATRDLLIRHGRKAPHDQRLVFLAIDNLSVSLDQLGAETIATSPALKLMKQSWPWPRQVHGLVLDRLVQAGAQTVIFDLLFPTPREGDQLLQQALDRHRDKVVIGSNFVDADRGGSLRTSLAVPSETVIPATTPLDNRIGYVNFWPDAVDGIIRSCNYRISLSQASQSDSVAEEEVYESLSSQGLHKAGLSHLIPKDEASHLFRYAGHYTPQYPDQGFEPVSLHEIFLENEWHHKFKDGEFFRGKIVLVGPEGNWSKDELNTPFGLIPGPEIHLNALNALLHHEFLTESSRTVNLFCIIAAGGLSLGLTLWIRSPLRRFCATLAVSLGYGALLFWLYSYPGIYLIALAPLLTLNGSNSLCFVYEFVLERLEKSRIRSTLDRYVSKNVADFILTNASTFTEQLGGTRKPVTILFSDIRGFTTMTESADSHALVTRLNEYLSAMAASVMKHEGRLDKYIGDAVMATWGDMKSDGPEKDATQAVLCALDMMSELVRLNGKWQTEGLSPWRIGIGLNFGEVIFGNMGATQKMEMTVIGDPVNLASRLEGQTKEYKQTILLGESVAALVKDRFTLQFVDAIQVKGKTQGVKVFRIESPKSGQEDEYLRSYEEGIRFFQERHFALAKDKFHHCTQLRHRDFLSEQWLNRATELEANPPGEDWDGVSVKTKK
jgi:adenylate cyclase